jgi:hypothetical protein
MSTPLADYFVLLNMVAPWLQKPWMALAPFKSKTGSVA